jgi:type IV pilus assembly protein PilC
MSNLRDFFLQLETSLSAGVSLPRTLHLLSENISGWGMKAKVKKMAEDIDRGKSLADAMQSAGSPFTQMQISFIRFGEQTGTIPAVCGSLAEHSDNELSLEREIFSALVYPLFLLFIVMVMAPILNAIVSQNSVWSATGGIIGAIALYVVILALLYGFYRLLGSGFASGFLIRIPFFGMIMRKLSLCRFTRSLGVGLEAGVPLGQCLETSIRVSANPWLEKELAGLKTAVRNGRPFGEGLRGIDALPSTMKEMIAVGEQSGKLPEMLKKTAQYFEDDARQRIKVLTKLLPILFFLPIALIVAYVVITMGSGILSGLPQL